MTRDWREMVRLGGNLFFILKISAVDPVRITEIGAHQAGMDHDAFLRDRLGKKVGMAKLIGGLGTSHVPSIGAAHRQGLARHAGLEALLRRLHPRPGMGARRTSRTSRS